MSLQSYIEMSNSDIEDNLKSQAKYLDYLSEAVADTAREMYRDLVECTVEDIEYYSDMYFEGDWYRLRKRFQEYCKDYPYLKSRKTNTYLNTCAHFRQSMLIALKRPR